MARSRLTGMKSTRRVIRMIPEVMKAEMRHVLEDAGPRIARQMQARAPRKTGALQAGIKWKVLPRTLKLQVGLLGTKAGRAKLFYGRILEFGRKAQVAQGMRQSNRKIWLAGITAGTMKAKVRPASLTYPIRVSALNPRRFITGAMPDLRRQLRSKLQGVWNRVLSKAAKGAGNE